MHILIITAHPSSHGFTHAIAESYRDACTTQGHTVEVLDPYRTELQMGFLRYEIPSDLKLPNATREALQAKITQAHELVIVFPIWWVSLPAILKNFFDTVFTSGFAFQYRK